jgi:asparagine synthase (glutamine-hydrolysing)
MCGIGGFYSLNSQALPSGANYLQVMGNLLAHRGPDDSGVWLSQKQSVGLVHKRLSIIDAVMNLGWDKIKRILRGYN